MTALRSQPITIPRLGGAWVNSDALCNLFKALRSIQTGCADCEFGKVIIETADPLDVFTVIACDGTHRAKVWSHRMQLEQRFNCMVPYELVNKLARMPDSSSNVWRLQYLAEDGERGFDRWGKRGKRCNVLEFLDDSGRVRLWAGDSSEGAWAKPVSNGVEPYHEFIRRSNNYAKHVRASNNPARTARILADLARLDDKRPPMRMESASGTTVYTGESYELRVFKHD